MKPLLALLFATLTFSTANAQHDPPSVHGMLIVGSTKVYLSHLPMFHSPHDYQAIFAATFSHDAFVIYQDARNNNPDEIFTLVPETFSLPDMAANPKPFKAQIFRGHFERGGKKIAETTVEISVLYLKKFRPNATEPEKPQFILFGNTNEQFAAHQIFAKPNYDQIFSVTTTADEARELELGSTILTLELSNPKSLYLETGDLSH